MATENIFTRKVCNQLKDAGCRVIVISGNRFSRNQPDRLVWSKYGKWLLEFKAETTRLRDAQLETLRDLNMVSEWSAFVVRADSEYGQTGGLLLSFDQEHVIDCFRNGKELMNVLKNVEKWCFDNALRPLWTES